MLSNKLAFAALGAACITAAAGGGYLATRQNAVPAPAAAASPVASPTATVPTAAGAPVQETEAVIAGTTTAPASATPPPATLSGVKPAVPKREARASTSAPAKTPAATTPARRDNPPALERPWPASAGSAPPASPSPAPSNESASSSTRTDERAAEAPRAPEAPQRTFEELVVSADSVIGLQTETRISSETARVEDRVEAHVTRDVKVGARVAIPAGAKAIGNVTLVEHGGKFKERARLGIRFRELVLADGTRVPMSTDTIFRDGDAPGNASAAKVGGGAVGGAILGAILGGAKGAAIGATVGAGGGAAVVQAGDRNAAVLPAGSQTTVRLLSPITITTDK